MKTYVTLSAFALLLGCASSANVPTPPTAAQQAAQATVTAQIDAIVQPYIAAGNFPGVVVGVAQNGTVVFAKGYGYRDITNKLPMTATTELPIASVTKHVTDAVILWLQEHPSSVLATMQPLSINDLLSKYVPAYNYANEMTLKQLIYNSAAVPGADLQSQYTTIFPNNGLTPVTEAQVIAGLNAAGLIAGKKPGDVYDYSNAGYWLLGEAVAAATGTSFTAFVSRNVFASLGMSSSSFLGSTPSNATLSQGYVHVHLTDPYSQCKDLDPSWTGAPAGIVTTVGDLLHWDYELRTGGYITTQDFAQMLTPFLLNDGVTYAGSIGANGTVSSVGMGVALGSAGYGAEGGLFGFQSLTYSFNDGIDVVVIANSGGGYTPEVKPTIATQVHNVISSGAPIPVPLIPAPLADPDETTLPAQFCSLVAGQ